MEGYKLSIIEKTLTITKAFEDEVSKGNGAEYDLYMKLIREIPDLKVVRKTHKTPSKYRSKSGEKFRCNQFKNLKYQNMEKFINGLPDSSEYMKQYRTIKNCAAPPQNSPYALVRKWFIMQFPEFRTQPWVYLFEKVDVVKAEPFLKKLESVKEAEDEAA